MEILEIQIAGKIQSSNFPVWKSSLLEKIHAINLELVTDNDFAGATEDAKALKKAEQLIQEAKVRAIEQTAEIQTLFAALDEVSGRAREARLVLERQIKKRKQEIKEGLLEEAVAEVSYHIAEQPETFRQLDNGKYLQRHQYEAAIKGKSTIDGLKRALAALVREFKEDIDGEVRRVMRNRAIINGIPTEQALLFQDQVYLVALPENELRLTIEKRLARVAEQAALRKAADVEKELDAVNADALAETPNRDQGRYLVVIELLCSRQEAIDTARVVRSSLSDKAFPSAVRLTRPRDGDAGSWEAAS